MDASGGFAWTNPDLPSAPEPDDRPKRSPLLVVIGLGVAIVAAWLVFTVVGGGSGGGGNLNPIAQAAEKTADVPGARVEMTGSVAIPQFPSGLTMSATGAYDFVNDGGEATATISDPASGQSMRFDYVYSGDSMYMSSSSLAPVLPAGKSWIEVKMEGANNADNPRAIIAQLQAVSSQITTVGRERIRGTMTTQYRALATINQTQVPVDVWVDRQGLVRRLVASGLAGNASASAAIRLDIFDYGYQPHEVVPPSDQVVDTQEIAKDLAAQYSQ